MMRGRLVNKTHKKVQEMRGITTAFLQSEENEWSVSEGMNRKGKRRKREWRGCGSVCHPTSLMTARTERQNETEKIPGKIEGTK